MLANLFLVKVWPRDSFVNKESMIRLLRGFAQVSLLLFRSTSFLDAFGHEVPFFLTSERL